MHPLQCAMTALEDASLITLQPPSIPFPWQPTPWQPRPLDVCLPFIRSVPVIVSLHHLIMITLIGSEGGLVCCLGSKVPLVGLGGQEKLETQLVFVIVNHVGVEKDAIPPLS